MNKLDANTVGSYWVIIVIIAMLTGGAFTFGINFLLMMIAAMIVCTFFLGAPYAIAWFWNKYIAEEEEEDEIDYSN